MDIRISETQKELLPYLLRGWKYEKIAAKTHWTVHNIRYHVKKLCQKFHVETRGEVVYEALIRGYVSISKDRTDGEESATHKSKEVQ